MTSLTPQRPNMHARQISSSSFAEAFDVARSKLGDLTFHGEEDEEAQSPSLSSTRSVSSGVPSPLLDSDGGSTPASPISPVSPVTGPATPGLDPDVADDFAFAFDIDGVLIRGGRPIPEAIEAMKVLNGENEFGIKVYVLKFSTSLFFFFDR
jgi:Haloacid dehalogenase-like hydrolase